MNSENAKSYFKQIDEAMRINPDKELLDLYLKLTKTKASNVVRWFFNGPNSIKLIVRVDAWTDQTIIFTYVNENFWSIQTLDYYIDKFINKEDIINE